MERMRLTFTDEQLERGARAMIEERNGVPLEQIDTNAMERTAILANAIADLEIALEAMRAELDTHSCEAVRQREQVDDRPRLGGRWQCTCGTVYGLHGGEWAALFVVPESSSLRRKSQ